MNATNNHLYLWDLNTQRAVEPSGYFHSPIMFSFELSVESMCPLHSLTANSRFAISDLQSWELNQRKASSRVGDAGSPGCE